MDKDVLMIKKSRERIIIGNNGKNEIIVTVRREPYKKRHILITVPADMKWTTIWRTLKRLPKHLQKQRKQKKTKSQQKVTVRTKANVR